MHKIKRANAAVHWYTNELTSRVVAESGRAEDRFHLGKLVLQGLKDAPDFVLQIDGGTGKSETCGSVLERSVKCANALRALGLQRGDVMILMAPNHLELAIPYYAALYLGLIIAPIDRFLQIRELEDVFSKDEPKIVFCQSEKARDVYSALNNCKVEAKVIHFDESKEQIDNSMSFDDLLKKYGSEYAVGDFKALTHAFQKITPNTEVYNVFGMSELTSLGFHTDDPPPGSCGKPLGCFQYRLIDLATQEDITEPYKEGELMIKGPGLFKGYYNNPSATKETFAEDGWFKTGDMFYRDENWNFFFKERIKMLLKYMSYHISPVELEGVIRQHPGVLDVAVTGIPDRECGDLAVACVVRKPGHDVTADEIKDLVKDSVAETKQLRGGVIFMQELPMTASTKVHRKKLKEMVLEMERE